MCQSRIKSLLHLPYLIICQAFYFLPQGVQIIWAADLFPEIFRND